MDASHRGSLAPSASHLSLSPTPQYWVKLRSNSNFYSFIFVSKERVKALVGGRHPLSCRHPR